MATPVSAQIKAKKETELGTAVKAGFVLANYHDTCIFFQMFFLPGKFFDRLRKLETSDGPQFRKGNQTLHSFPDTLIVDIQATAFKCAGLVDQTPPLEFASGLLSTLSFEANWKTGDQVRPALIESVQPRHRKLSARWNYFLEIPAKDVPLTEQLVIEVTSRDHIKLCRINSDLNHAD
jgi:hypothetical protein